MLNDTDSDAYEVNVVESDHRENTENNEAHTSDSCSTCYEPTRENTTQRSESAARDAFDHEHSEISDSDLAQVEDLSTEQGGHIDEHGGEPLDSADAEQVDPQEMKRVEQTSEEEYISSDEAIDDADDSRLVAPIAGGQLMRTVMMTYLEPSREVVQTITTAVQNEASQDPGYLGETEDTESTSGPVRRRSRAALMHRFYSRREAERDRSYHHMASRTRMTYHRFDANRLLDRRINERE